MLGVEAALRPGAFHVARKFGLGVVPIAVAGTHRVWEHPFSGRLRYGQRVRLTVLPVVSAAQVAAARDLETLRLRVSADLKSAALCAGGPPARRFDPDADGFWDGFAFEIDPQFDAVRRRVQQHRAERLAARRQDPQLRGAAASSRFAIARRPSTVIRHTAANR